MIRNYPPNRKVALGLVLASAVAATPTIMFGSFVVVAYPIGFVLAGLHAFLLGLPLYLLLRRWFAVGFVNAAISGLIVGFLPMALMSIADNLDAAARGRSFESLWVTFGVPLIAGALGAVGGLVFRAVIGRVDPLPDYGDTFE